MLLTGLIRVIYFSLSLALVVCATSCIKSKEDGADPNIVSGVLVEESDPVYLATVSLNWNGNPTCSGFIFDKRTIVTAAHCMATVPSDVVFAVGFGSKNRNLKKEIKVEKYELHPGWDRSDLRSSTIDPLPGKPKNDIGVIILADDAPDWVKPIPVKEIGSVNIGANAVLAGYGRTDGIVRDPSTSMPEARGLLRKTNAVISVINEDGLEFIEDTTADNPRGSSCHGDSGGPMFFVENDGSLTVIGVTSRAYSKELDCKGKGVYTDVRKFTGWIRETREKLMREIVDPNEWLHRNFEATDGTKISLDYQLQARSVEKLARVIWVNVQRPGFSGNETVTVKLSSYINSLNSQDLSLKYADEGRFTGKFDKFEGQPVCSPYSRWGVQQDLQIIVNDKPLLDKNSSQKEFKFKFCN